MKSGFWKGLVLGIAVSVLALAGISAFGRLFYLNVGANDIKNADPATLDSQAFEVINVMEDDLKRNLPTETMTMGTTIATAKLMYIQIRQNNIIIDRLDKLLEK